MNGTSKLNHDVRDAIINRNQPKDTNNISTMFVGLTVSMSWQLAVVLLAGLLGGHELDVHFKTVPLWTLVGLALAMVAMVLIIRRTLQKLNTYMDQSSKEQPQ